MITTGDAAYHAYLWTPTTPNGTSGTMLDLATLGGLNSYSYNVGAGGQVVGASEVEITSDDTHAFLYTSGSGMVDLNTLIDPLSGWELLDASAHQRRRADHRTGADRWRVPRVFAHARSPIPGDFNHDGTVDAADYVVWRKTDGDDQPGYNTWRANFGQPAGSGSGAGANADRPRTGNVGDADVCGGRHGVSGDAGPHRKCQKLS